MLYKMLTLVSVYVMHHMHHHTQYKFSTGVMQHFAPIHILYITWFSIDIIQHDGFCLYYASWLLSYIILVFYWCYATFSPIHIPYITWNSIDVIQHSHWFLFILCIMVVIIDIKYMFSTDVMQHFHVYI